MIKIVHTSISPCDNERRIFNQALSASRHGYEVSVIALKSPEVDEISILENIGIQRLKIPSWEGGPLKFLFFNWKLFRHLLKRDIGILHAHDLWVLPGSVCAAWFKKAPVVYDAHEFYRGLEIFNQKKLSGKIWALTEWLFIRFAKKILTINASHGDLYKKTYPRIFQPEVIMNLPERKGNAHASELPLFHDRKNSILFQGIFKPGRALPQVIRAFAETDNGTLEFVGHGEIEQQLKQLTLELELSEKVYFLGKADWKDLCRRTQQAKAGLVLFEPTSINYKYASPNKFFEYVMAGTPLIASDIPTFREFISEHEVGILVNPDSGEEIISAIRSLLTNEKLWNKYHQNCLKAREVWNWEQQEPKLLSVYRELSSGLMPD